MSTDPLYPVRWHVIDCPRCLLHHNVVSLCRGFVTTELVSLGGKIGTDTACAGCQRVERTVYCEGHTGANG